MFAWLAATSREVAAASKRNDKVAALAEVIERVQAHQPSEVPAAVAYLTGETLIGRLGVGYASLSSVDAAPAAEASLSIGGVSEALERLAATTGSGSQAARRRQLDELFGAATVDEQRLLAAIIGGELRQGALDGVVTTAVAKAAGVPVSVVQRAAMFLGSLPFTAAVALDEGRAGLDTVELQPGVAVQPMLASPATDAADALADMGDGAVAQWKFDGARLQAHRVGGAVQLFTRNLNDITDRLPAIAAAVASLPTGDLVLDGEVMGVTADGRPRPFQDTMGDFSADDIDRGGDLAPFWFDLLVADGTSIVDRPLAERLDLLASIVPAERLVPGTEVADAAAVDRVFDEAVAAGHEGVVVKRLDSLYEAGRRGKFWRKIKPVYTYDLVVLAAEWGHGRRTGWLSNLHLGARERATGEFVMVGKTFKGLTDELLAWQTERLLELETHRDGHTVFVRPELVVEIAIDGVQRSTRYPGGIALRFARVKRYRTDKEATDADTLDALVAHRETNADRPDSTG